MDQLWLLLIAVFGLGCMVGVSLKDGSKVRDLRHDLQLARSLNLELKDRLVDRERAEDQREQIERIPGEQQIEILENWMGNAA